MTDDWTHWLFVGLIVFAVAWLLLAAYLERRSARRRYGTIAITHPLFRPRPPWWRPIARWKLHHEPFYITIDAGTPTQETIEVTGWNSTELTIRRPRGGVD